MRERKKVLCIASVASNLDNFNRRNVQLLQKLGYDITIASNFNVEEDSSSAEKIDLFQQQMRSEGIHIVQIDFTRKIGNIRQQIISFRQVGELLKNHYDLIHCHTPICSAITRMNAQKYRKQHITKVIYTAHGFHFFKGAPLKNWLCFCPVEMLCSRWTDMLITINEEDFHFAQKHMKAGKTVYISGIGIDTEKFRTCAVDREHKRKELGIPPHEKILISVGELNTNKNQKTMIQAVAKLKNPSIHYLIVGVGQNEQELKQIVRTLHLEKQVHFLGYRRDIHELDKISDIFVFPSFREGLSASLMEAMASGLPCIVSAVRGNRDLIENGKGGFWAKPDSADEFAEKIKFLTLC